MQHDPTWPNLPAMMLALARAWSDRPMLRVFRDSAWQRTTWGGFGRAAASVARGLTAAGVGPGDRVLIVADNRPEYPIAETALMAIRAVPVPAYVSNTIEDHAHLLRDSGARVAIVGSQALAGRVREAGARAGGLDLLVVMDGALEAAAGRPRLLPWRVLAADTAAPDDVARAAAAIPTNTLACLIYTSGTGGAPRGVMLPHRSILSNCHGAIELLRSLRLGENEVYLSFLPTAHSYEHTVGLFFLPSLGIEIVYARGIEHLASDLRTVRPTILTAVPRVLEAVRGRVLGQMARQPAWRQALFARALALGTKRLDRLPLSLAERVADPLLDRLVRAKVRARFGGRVKGIMSGGARLEPEVGRFFLALGLPVMQGYGQTEAGPVISANPPDAIRIDTVGRPLRGVELRLAEDHEILVRGDLVMDGYWRRPDDTAATIRDGWLHTGDIGALDADGYLRITDRKKDMIVLSGGENVSPAKIEGMLVAEPEIAQAVVAGDGRAGLSALVVPAEGQDEIGVALAVARVNLRLSVTERIRHHAVVGAFTIENGLLTPSHKVRRLLVLRANTEALARLHG
ncbi:MAG TPA: long-chain fatty acid--CoA ligase [Acetobacteraceae bacterium]|nr:long-chain fatty acid--CoA ligase [Acetobacteraceae bacterium]